MIEGTCLYIKTVREHLDLLNGTQQGRQLLIRLRGFRLPIIESPRNCSFVEKSWWATSESSLIGRTRIEYDTSYRAPSAPYAPPWVYLFHELVHANQSLRMGTYDSDRECRAVGLGRFTTEMFSENALRCELVRDGLLGPDRKPIALRPSYSGAVCGPKGTCINGSYR